MLREDGMNKKEKQETEQVRKAQRFQGSVSIKYSDR
jgi:hypothetical protein